LASCARRRWAARPARRAIAPSRNRGRRGSAWCRRRRATLPPWPTPWPTRPRGGYRIPSSARAPWPAGSWPRSRSSAPPCPRSSAPRPRDGRWGAPLHTRVRPFPDDPEAALGEPDAGGREAEAAGVQRHQRDAEAVALLADEVRLRNADLVEPDDAVLD